MHSSSNDKQDEVKMMMNRENDRNKNNNNDDSNSDSNDSSDKSDQEIFTFKQNQQRDQNQNWDQKHLWWNNTFSWHIFHQKRDQQTESSSRQTQIVVCLWQIFCCVVSTQDVFCDLHTQLIHIHTAIIFEQNCLFCIQNCMCCLLWLDFLSLHISRKIFLLLLLLNWSQKNHNSQCWHELGETVKI